MNRYIASLAVAVVFMALVFVAWTPVAKATQPICEEYCQSLYVCGCVGKLTGNVRRTKCEFSGDLNSCGYSVHYAICDCGDVTGVKGCLRLKENPVAWDSVVFPVVCDPCYEGETSQCIPPPLG
jgi:hypothetical protein